ncbi:FimV/HubP family polar landmark protein [Nitrosomonas sp.]|uniref:FimV/HubP family polar landmark protein n=1 Tax=Nitrosomonas sp. TaxID=42353 RepID=UPI0025DBE361|nr:FimV/HubP family polar landmark protein [Nitrosomonas sp.]
MFVIILMLPAAIYAAGLGKLILNSALGQPLNAEIDIVTTNSDEIPTLKASVATREAFAQAGISYESVLSTVQVSVESRVNGGPYVKLTSPQAVNDPFLMVLIELSWSSGKILREYTVLLDPADSNTQNFAAASASHTPQITTSRLETDNVAEIEEDRKSDTRTRTRDNTSNRQGAKTYGPVSRGDTLSSIARRVLPPGVNLNQMLVALHRANREAFIANNMNLLKAGAILNIPDQNEIAAIDTTTASAEIKMQTNDWRQYQAKLATVSRESSSSPSISQSDQGQITTTIDKKSIAAPDTPKEVLKLSSGAQLLENDGQVADSSLVDRLRMMEEDAIARNLALKEANERVAMLEKSVANLKHLLELKDSVLAQAQVNAESLSAGNLKPETPPPAIIDSPVETNAEPEVHAAPSEAEPVPIVQPVQEPSIVASPAPLPAENEQGPGLIELLFEYLEYIAGASVLVLLLVFLIIRRRRKQLEDDDEEEESRKEDFSSTMRSRMAAMTGASAAAAATAADDDRYPAASEDNDEELTYENTHSYSEPTDRDDEFSHDEPDFEENIENDEAAKSIAGATDDETDRVLQREEQSIDSSLIDENSEDNLEQPVDSVPNDQEMDFSNQIDFDLDAESDEKETKRELSQSSNDAGIDMLSHDVESLDYPLEVAADETETDDSGTSGRVAAEMDQDEVVLDFDPASIDLDDEETSVKKEDSVLSDASDSISDAIEFEQSEEIELDSSPETPAIDLADINLDLDESNQTDQVEEMADLETNSEQWQEVETKLDLAKAYQEMDDKEGAKEMLEEVIRDGDAKQKKIAKKMLKSL